MAQRVLVTGGTGLIGGEVILALARAGVRVTAVTRGGTQAIASQRLRDRLQKSQWFAPELLGQIEVLAGDTTLPGFGLTPPMEIPPDGIVHCAANTQFSDREEDDVWRTNVGGAEHLVAFARAHAPGARVVFVSTASVTTGPEGAVVNEDAAFQGYENAYTRSKRQAEAIVTASGLDTVILRPSIVLSRGIDDAAMARSILWAVPIMRELGEVPVNPDTHIDIVPVDYTAQCIADVALAPSVPHRLYHISAGRTSQSFRQLLDAVTAECPEFQGIAPVGRKPLSKRAMARLMRPLENYLPFMNADIRYGNDRLLGDFTGISMPALATSYVPSLVALISLADALTEMVRP